MNWPPLYVAVSGFQRFDQIFALLFKRTKYREIFLFKKDNLYDF